MVLTSGSGRSTSRPRRHDRSVIQRDSGRAWSFRSTAAVTFTCGAGGALGHTFAPPYTLPVPFSMYAFGAAAALVLSFVIVGVFATAPSLTARPRDRRPVAAAAAPPASTGCDRRPGAERRLLMLCIVTGLFGTQNPYANFNMTFFWIVFVLGVPYLTAVVGDFYAAVNPWKVLVERSERSSRAASSAACAIPSGCGYYPALVLYMAFIWLELFGRTHATGPFGRAGGLHRRSTSPAPGCSEASMVPHGRVLRRVPAPARQDVALGRPWDPQEEPRPAAGAGACRSPACWKSEPTTSASCCSSSSCCRRRRSTGCTARSHGSTIFWKDIYPHIAPILLALAGQQYALSAKLYYCVAVDFALDLAAGLSGGVRRLRRGREGRDAVRLSVQELAVRFALSLVPIAFVYHVTHYYTMLLAQGGQIVRLVSDPFGFGWNLFGTAQGGSIRSDRRRSDLAHPGRTHPGRPHRQRLPRAHRGAPDLPHAAARCRQPASMLVLMMLFTTMGLWILSLPLSIGG